MQHTFYVSGIFCHACRLFIEQQLSAVGGVSDVRVDEVTQTVTLTLGSQYGGAAWLVVLNQALTAHGYTLGIAPPVRDNQTIWHALPLGLLLLYGFIVAQQSGWLHFDFQHSIAPASAFLLGLIASTSSCLLVVGGLVLSLSAQPQLPRRALFEFHVGRLAGFVVLGAVLGGLGQVLDIGLGAWLQRLMSPSSSKRSSLRKAGLPQWRSSYTTQPSAHRSTGLPRYPRWASAGEAISGAR